MKNPKKNKKKTKNKNLFHGKKFAKERIKKTIEKVRIIELSNYRIRFSIWFNKSSS